MEIGASSKATAAASTTHPGREFIRRLEAARKGAETRFNIVHFMQMPHGGHFPAFEQPKLWVDDIRAFLATVRKG
jgi:hypothetical protein